MRLAEPGVRRGGVVRRGRGVRGGATRWVLVGVVAAAALLAPAAPAGGVSPGDGGAGVAGGGVPATGVAQLVELAGREVGVGPGRGDVAPSGARRRELEVRAGAGATLAGVVIDDAGRGPGAAAHVALSRGGGAQVAVEVERGEGRWASEAVPVRPGEVLVWSVPAGVRVVPVAVVDGPAPVGGWGGGSAAGAAVTDAAGTAAVGTVGSESVGTPPVAVRSRAEWGARPARPLSTTAATEAVVVHHTVTPNGYGAADVPRWLRSMQAYHMDALGWADLGYHVVVDRFGVAWEGREGAVTGTVLGAHSGGFNTATWGISLLGDYTSTGAPDAALVTVGRLAGWRLAASGRAATGDVTLVSSGSGRFAAGQAVVLPRVMGHRDNGSTTCPGAVWGQLARIRQVADDTARSMVPAGQVNAVVGGARSVRVDGWAAAAGGAAVDVEVSAGAGTAVVRPSIPRPDVTAVHRWVQGNPGYSVTVAAPVGWVEVCPRARSATGASGGVGCGSVVVADPGGGSPTGTAATGVGAGFVEASGTVADRDGPVQVVRVLVDGVPARTAPPGAGGAYRVRVDGVAGGLRRVCVRADNVGPGEGVTLGCVDVVVPGAAPVGALESVEPKRGSVRVRGWAYDPETVGASRVLVTVPGRWEVTEARWRREDVAGLPAWAGDDHGFDVEVPVGVGRTPVCVAALDVGGTDHRLLGCREVVVVK